MTETLEVTTESNQQYKFYPVASGSIRFEVKTWKDAHLVLTSGPKETDPRYEVIIGGWENTKSVIRRKGKNPDQKEIQTPGILTDKEFRRFSIRWDGNTVQVHQYTEGQSQPRKLMEFKDPDRFPITFVGVGTGWGASGTWKFEDGTEVFTPDSKDKLQYKYAPVSTGYLHFVYRGPHNAHVCLTSGPRETDPMYEINFGGDDNMKSAIRYRRNASDKVTLSTPGLMDPSTDKEFLIDWSYNRVVVREVPSSGNSPPSELMEWESTAAFPITHFGLRTGDGARGHWRVRFYWTGDAFLRPGKGNA
ncbi:uncharacterized protein LOC135087680 [Ostrinia nubilalis]|uniref:uncharacterized protein LOC135087680 n=1 Tax=Ostrinia nubilalis TaxID=29057 RepID=UPI0030822020